MLLLFVAEQIAWWVIHARRLDTMSVLTNLHIARLLHPTSFPFHLYLSLSSTDLWLLSRNNLHGFLGDLHSRSCSHILITIIHCSCIVLAQKVWTRSANHLRLIDSIILRQLYRASAESNSFPTCSAFSITSYHLETCGHGGSIVEHLRW